MVATGPGLGVVLDVALRNWRPRAEQGFGAMPHAAPAPVTADQMQRLFGTDTGRQAVIAVGDPLRALAAVERLSVEVLAASLRFSDQVTDADRLLVVPGALVRLL